ncbi:MAG: SCP2 domain-containing protein [Azonexus sp.]
MERLRRFFQLPLNHLLRQNAWAANRLARHAGSTVLVRTATADLFSFAIAAGGELQTRDAAGETDVTIELPADFATRLLRDRQSLSASARLSGSAELAESLAFVLRNLRWDSEADLARFIGDIPARRLDQFARQSLRQTQDAARRSAANLAEYLTHETALIVQPAEFAAFSAESKELAARLQQLEQRLARLAP